MSQYAFKMLRLKKQSHSKIKHIEYRKLEIKPYLKSPLFSKQDASTLFGLISRTIRTIRKDFREYYKPNLNCPVCNAHLYSLSEMSNCPRLKSEVTTLPQSDQQIINKLNIRTFSKLIQLFRRKQPKPIHYY